VAGKCQQRAFPVNLARQPNFRLARIPAGALASSSFRLTFDTSEKYACGECRHEMKKSASPCSRGLSIC
jgi:hypothetical protein